MPWVQERPPRPFNQSASAGVTLGTDALSSAKATKFFLSRATMVASFRIASRASSPLPQTQPMTLPVLTTMKIGFLVFAASRRASVSEYFHGMLVQGWFLRSRTGLSSLNSASVNPVPVVFGALDPLARIAG